MFESYLKCLSISPSELVCISAYTCDAMVVLAGDSLLATEHLPAASCIKDKENGMLRPSMQMPWRHFSASHGELHRRILCLLLPNPG